MLDLSDKPFDHYNYDGIIYHLLRTPLVPLKPAIIEYSSAGNCIDSHDNAFSLFYVETAEE